MVGRLSEWSTPTPTSGVGPPGTPQCRAQAFHSRTPPSLLVPKLITHRSPPPLIVRKTRAQASRNGAVGPGSLSHAPVCALEARPRRGREGRPGGIEAELLLREFGLVRIAEFGASELSIGREAPYVRLDSIYAASAAENSRLLARSVNFQGAHATAKLLDAPLDLFRALEHQPPFPLYVCAFRAWDERRGEEVRVGFGCADVRCKRALEDRERRREWRERREGRFGRDCAVCECLLLEE